MTDINRTERTEDDGVADARPACVALVPVNPSVERTRISSLHSVRPSAFFVTHLIATAAQAPQTRSLRRASLADAQTAYSVSRRVPQTAGFRTRHTI
jgi:hypothetical protein